MSALQEFTIPSWDDNRPALEDWFSLYPTLPHSAYLPAYEGPTLRSYHRRAALKRLATAMAIRPLYLDARFQRVRSTAQQEYIVWWTMRKELSTFKFWVELVRQDALWLHQHDYDLWSISNQERARILALETTLEKEFRRDRAELFEIKFKKQASAKERASRRAAAAQDQAGQDGNP